MSLTRDMGWRYACQEFQAGQRCDASLAEAIEAARLAPSSFGVQPWRIVAVDDAALRSDLPDLCYGQTSVRDAGHLLVFAYCDPLSEDHLRAHARRVAVQRDFSSREEDDFHADLVKTLLTRRDPAARSEWARSQCYLGLGVFLAACAHHRVDSCPMEGFKPEKVDALLGLDRMGLRSAVLVAAGIRAATDRTARAPKVRLDHGQFLTRIGGTEARLRA